MYSKVEGILTGILLKAAGEPDLSDAEVLRRLLELNLMRAGGTEQKALV